MLLRSSVVPLVVAAAIAVGASAVPDAKFEVDCETASKLAGLAMECHDQEWPHK
jgi:photosystem II stability/assembly factor-like uncharacterized protein